MARYRLCGGLAIMPEHDMAMLADMSARGWHLSGFSCGILYRFEAGEPHAYDYAVDFQRDFSAEAQELYRIGGWQSVAMGSSCRSCAPRPAPSRCTPTTTRRRDDRREPAGLGWAALVCALAAALLFALQARLSVQGNVPGSWACLAACAVFAAGFVFSFFPFVGYTRSLRNMRREQEEDPRR
ncbi:MAG: DUF2812 domain-containing protein [Eggerthella lenta]